MPYTQPPADSQKRRNSLEWATWLVLLLVATSLAGRNVIADHPRVAHVEWMGPPIAPLGFRVESRLLVKRWGWPATFREQSEWVFPDHSYRPPPPVWHNPTFRADDPRTWALVGDVLCALVILTGTVCFVEHWVRHRRGPFQFRLKTLFLVTALVAVALTFLTQRAIRWDGLLFLPIGFGLLCTAGTLGLGIKACFGAEDARLSRLRRRFADPEAAPTENAREKTGEG